MRGRRVRYLLTGTAVTMLTACSSKLTDHGQQYKDGRLTQPFSLVSQPGAIGAPINAGDFAKQISHIHSSSSRLYSNQSNVYNMVQEWLHAGGDTRNMRQFDIDAWQMEGVDNYSNVQFTGYYTSITQMRRTRQGELRYPIYHMPPKRDRLPSCTEIYAGALSDKYILAYSNSLMNNFIVDTQDNGYIDFGDGNPLDLFSYAGRNGRAYRSIGKMLINRGEVKKEDMSMRAIRHWSKTHSEAEVRELLGQNSSFVFFKPQSFAPVKGANAVPLVGRASVASGCPIIPPGTILLAEVPLLDSNGKFNSRYELCLMVVLDVSGAIKDQHFGIYQGVGSEVGYYAGWYNHYGCVQVLETAPDAGNVFNGRHDILYAVFTDTTR